MSSDLVLDGATYISSKRASELSGYSQDYIGQLARAGKIIARRVGGLWYVLEESLRGHKQVSDNFVPTPPPPESIKPVVAAEDASLVMLDGRSYVSSARAAKLTAYHPDYIGQLARTGKILSRQVGNRWYVDIEGLKKHKSEKDALLGAVQAVSVGLMNQRPDDLGADVPPHASNKSYFRYFSESHPLFPLMKDNILEEENIGASPETLHETNRIPIRVVHAQKISPHLNSGVAAHPVQAHVPLHASLVGSGIRIVGQPISSKVSRIVHLQFRKKSIFYVSFTATVITLVIIVALNVQLFKPTTFIAKRGTNAAFSSAVVKEAPVAALVEFAGTLFSKRIVFER